MSGHEHERLSAYVDGELLPVERAAVAAHLDSCAECQGRLAELRAADAAAAGMPAAAPPGYFEAFPARVRARLEPRAARRSLPAWTWAAAAALLLVVVTPLSLLRRPALAPVELSRQAPAAAAPAAAAPVAPAPAEEAAPPVASAEPAAPARPDGLAKMAQAPAARRPAAPVEREAAFAPPPGEADARALEAEAAQAEAELPTLADAAGASAAPAVAPRNQATAFEERKAQDRSRDAAAARREPATAEAIGPQAAGGRVSAAPLAAPAGAAGLVVPEVEWRRLDAARPRTAAEWRRLRDEWRAFVARDPQGPQADAARVRAVEAALAAWRASADPADAAAFRGEAAAYLAREDASQRGRVRALLEAAAARP